MMGAQKQFSPQDVSDYYDQTEVHYRMFWRLEKSLGLHYGIWEPAIKNLPQAILNTNQKLAKLGQITEGEKGLDAGCGIGGSSFFLAKHLSCQMEGITLSQKQVNTATIKAKGWGLEKEARFSKQDYTATNFPDASFDFVWAIESMETAPDKSAFLKEANRVLKPGGKLLIADIFKPHSYPIESVPIMQKFLHAWAMTDILSLEEFKELSQQQGFYIQAHEDVNRKVWPSVWRIYLAGLLGYFGTKGYNLFHRASYFSRIHYTSGINQYKTYRKGQWAYHLWCLEKK